MYPVESLLYKCHQNTVISPSRRVDNGVGKLDAHLSPDGHGQLSYRDGYIENLEVPQEISGRPLQLRVTPTITSIHVIMLIAPFPRNAPVLEWPGQIAHLETR